ncbi:MAG: hypothetical protein GY703_00035 [Gammaproteobacteria bacterium]|nr:hypothetical protein [Gammaproteobacteria bacterium]
MAESKVYEFSGEKVKVCWDKQLCIHVGECVQAKGDLFIMGRDPWCQPDLTTVDSVADVVDRCPSGALYYDSKGDEQGVADWENTAVVAGNGPLFVRGDLEIDGVDGEKPGVRFRAALCRCGHSANKPFCDNSHVKVGFEDYGAVGETGDGKAGDSGKLKITPLQDGPLLFSGNLTICAGSGRKAWSGTNVALCRCGASKNKPFCDGAHREAGFKSD